MIIYLTVALKCDWEEPYAAFRIAFGLNPVIFLKRYLEYLFILVISGACCYILCCLVTTDIILCVIAKLFICSIVPNLFFFIVFRKTEEMKYIVSTIRKIKNLIIKKEEYK